MTEPMPRPANEFRPVVFSLTCFVSLLLAALFFLAGQEEAPLAIIELTTLEVEAPETIGVGETFTVNVVGAADGELVTLSIDAGYGPERFEVEADEDSAVFVVSPWPDPGAGTVLLDAMAASGRGVGTIEVVPDEAVDSIDIYVGPRTVIADDEDFSMIVAVPIDQYGNPVVTGTSVDFVVTREQVAVATPSEQIVAPTSGLLAWVNVVAGTIAGRTTVGVVVDDAGGPERSFLEVADVPVDVELETVGLAPVADGASLFEIRTSVLADQYDNIVPDGTIAYLHAEGSTGRRRLTSTTVDGVATFVVEAPPVAGPTEFISHVSGAVSETLVIDFVPAVVDLPVTVAERDGQLEIVIGRVTAVDAAYVPDGTIASVVVGSTKVEVGLELGLAVVEIDMTSEPVTVSVLGVDATVVTDNRS